MIHIKHADAWTELPLLETSSIDLICTDVPYMSYSSRTESKAHTERRQIEGVFTDADFYRFTEIAFRLLRPGRHIYMWTQAGHPFVQTYLALLQAGFTYNQTLVWPKINFTKSGDYYTTYPSQTELCIFAEKPVADPKLRRKLNGNVHSNLLSEFPSIPSERMTHPTQKPVGMLQFLVEKSSNEGELVLDPFMGSGSCAFACKHAHRNFIGFELVESYVKMIQFHLGEE